MHRPGLVLPEEDANRWAVSWVFLDNIDREIRIGATKQGGQGPPRSWYAFSPEWRWVLLDGLVQVPADALGGEVRRLRPQGPLDSSPRWTVSYLVLMWRIDRFENRRVRMDFRSSGQGSPEVTQVLAEGVVFANAVELTDWSETNRLQVLVCESCGIEHCEPGGWLCPRSAGEYVVFVPAFAAMLEGESESAEYRPPPYVSKRGIPVCDPAAYATLRERCAGLPAQEQLPRLNGVDLLRSLQWEAPMRVLGRFPQPPELRRDLVLASSDGDVEEVISRVARLLHEVGEMHSVALRPAVAKEEAVTLYLDGAATPEWAPLVAGVDEQYRLSPMPGVVAERPYSSS